MRRICCLLLLSFLSRWAQGQTLLIIRPDSTVRDTLRAGNRIRISLDPAENWSYSSQIRQITTDSIQLRTAEQVFWSSTRWVRINQVTGLRKASVLSGSAARDVYQYAFLLAGIFLPRHVFHKYNGWSIPQKIGVNVVSGVVLAEAFNLLANKILWPQKMHQTRKKGWRFEIVY